MVDLNRLPEGSSEGSIPDSNIPMAEILDSHDESVVGDPATHHYQLNHDSNNDQEDNKPVVVPQGQEDDEEEEEDEVEEQRVNYFQWTQLAYAQPEMTRQYDHPSHFRLLNLDAMNLGSYDFQGGPNDDPVDEFEDYHLHGPPPVHDPYQLLVCGAPHFWTALLVTHHQLVAPSLVRQATNPGKMGESRQQQAQ
ncbi:hypothetical protein PIB30_004332 [Stylosanthes scabra]|uniref:Uncharacterized protein n=1 Tax=Stylosanthes scabra TaxID=79078 RepID=A0ABU6T4S1_9FABA|nr:hypothetical protein [Stylosanthes scabra]